MADRNVNDPNDPQNDAAERATWDLGDQVERTDERTNLIDPDPQAEQFGGDESDPTLSDAGVDTQALADDDLRIDEGAATFGSDDTQDIIGGPDDFQESDQAAEFPEPARFEREIDEPVAGHAPESAVSPEPEPAAYPEPEPVVSPEPVEEPEPVAAPVEEPEPLVEPAETSKYEPAEVADEPRTRTGIPHVAAAGEGDQEIPRDVLERRLGNDDDYERRRDIDLSKLNPEPEKPAVPTSYEGDGDDLSNTNDFDTDDDLDNAKRESDTEAATYSADDEEIEIDYSKYQEDDDPEVKYTREEIRAEDARPGAPADPALAAAAGAGVAAAASDDDDDLESTKVRRQSLLARDTRNEDETTTQPAEATAAWRPRESAPTEAEIDASIFDEATVVPEVPSRVGARIWSFFLTLLGFPVAWYLITDAAARLTLAEGNTMSTGIINPLALGELGAGAIVAIILILLTIRSSLGAIIFGFLFMVAGGFFLAVPTMTAEFMDPAYKWLIAFNDFGGNVAHHIQWTGYTGTLAVAGLMLFVIGLTSMFARRDGRREQDIKAQIERMAPGTLKKGRRKKKA